MNHSVHRVEFPTPHESTMSVTKCIPHNSIELSSYPESPRKVPLKAPKLFYSDSHFGSPESSQKESQTREVLLAISPATLLSYLELESRTSKAAMFGKWVKYPAKF